MRKHIKFLLSLGLCSTIAIEAAVPNTPSSIGISKLTNTSVRLSMKDNSSDAYGFHISFYEYSTSSLFKTIFVPSSDKSYVYTNMGGLTCDKTYKVVVTAENADGNSTQSNKYFNLKSTFGANCSDVVIVPPPPLPPSEPEEENSELSMPGPYIGISSVNGSSTSVAISFKDNSNNEDGFRIVGDGIDVNVSANDETKNTYVKVTLSNLNCNDVYQIQALSYKDGITSDKTNKRAFRIRSTLGIPCVEKNPVELALEKIGRYADNNSNPLPILQDYIDAGIVGVTADNLAALNAAVALKSQVEINTIIKLNALVLAVTSSSCITREELIAKIQNYTLFDLGAVDTSCITDMSYLFSGMVNFNQDISGWDTSNVTNMSHMFSKAVSFNQDISGWDTSNVTNMSHMFSGYSFDDVGSHPDNIPYIVLIMSFNQPIGNWDVSKVTDMSGMFSSHQTFNQDLSSWNVSKVSNMSQMFQGATVFNKNISSWDTSSVTDMSRMFKALPFGRNYYSTLNTLFNQPIEEWDVSKVTDMSEMFLGATSFNQSLNKWNISSMNNMERMFYQARAFNGLVDLWDVSAVNNMKELFRGAESFNQDISEWNTLNVVNMEGMFDVYLDQSNPVPAIMSFSQNLSGWNVNNVVFHNRFLGVMAGNIMPIWVN